ncbi:hypothetical protein AMS68_003169 [Peltaster fructicola]|uniref:Actin-like ATPase domain-containing protein n=1 Tax=Peltaster fructicola TaxID=286661 RepID=A0A6H0XSB1_9PEZI|nr:hypothetical protein AMS68_003169 [Peltaster fructicola]
MSVAVNRSIRSDLIDKYHASPASPRTPLVERSISGTFSSPGSYGRENEDIIVYELDCRGLKVGWAGESTPRCTWRFGYAVSENARIGDYSHLTSGRRRTTMEDHVLYQADLRDADLNLVRAKLERVVRVVHLDYLQLSPKAAAKRAALIVSPLTSTKILELTLGVLFEHFSLPPSITLLTIPSMVCVGAGVREGLVIHVDWEETVISAVSEYRIVAERRTIRGGKLLHEATTKLLHNEVSKLNMEGIVDFATTEEVKDRLAWYESEHTPKQVASKLVTIPISHDVEISVSFDSFAKIVKSTFFAHESITSGSPVPDDNDHSLPDLAYKVLRDLARDTRGACAQRIIVDGPQHRIPGLRQGILKGTQSLIDAHGWRAVTGSKQQDHLETSRRSSSSSDEEDHFATPRAGSPVGTTVKEDQPVAISAIVGNAESSALSDASTSQAPTTSAGLDEEVSSPQDSAKALATTLLTPAGLRAQDDVKDHVSQKAEREGRKRQRQPFSGKVRGVDSLGAWAGASMAMNLRVKGVCEVDREDFIKHGLRDSVSLLI